jgi:hypothetical protein
MANKYIFEIFEEVSKKSKKDEKIQVLKNNESWALKDVLRGIFDSRVQWVLPKGEVPYSPSEPHNHPSQLLRENKKFQYFVKGISACDNLPTIKREKLFLGMIESIHPEDAKIVVDMINKKAPKGLTQKVVEDAFPGLLG